MATLRDFKNDEPYWSEANAHIRGQLAYQGRLNDIVEETKAEAEKEKAKALAKAEKEKTEAVAETKKQTHLESMSNYMNLKFNDISLLAFIEKLDLESIEELNKLIYGFDSLDEIKKWIEKH